MNNLEVCKCRFISLRLIKSLRKLTAIDYYQDNYDANLAAANWHNKVLEIMQTCIPQQTLTKRRNLPKNDSSYQKM